MITAALEDRIRDIAGRYTISDEAVKELLSVASDAYDLGYDERERAEERDARDRQDRAE